MTGTDIARWMGGLRDTFVRLIRREQLTPEAAPAAGGTSQARLEYGYYPARRARYALMAALCQNTAYSKLHRWSGSLRADFDLSPNVRPVFNPFYRLVEFWGTHTYSGTRDPECGDGKSRPSSVPIETRNEDLRPALARVLHESEWDTNVALYARTGAMLGDVGLYAVDDVANRRSTVEVIDPNSIVEYHADTLGRCHRYAIEEWRPDPRPGAFVDIYGEVARVVYREEGELVRDASGDPVACRFRTYLVDSDAEPFDWGGSDSGDGWEWEEPYPFVPLVLVPHSKALPGQPWGQPEGMPVLAKILELDDVASRFHDFIGKSVDPIWLFKAVRQPTPQEQLEIMNGGRDGIPALYGGAEAGAQCLLAALNLADVDGHLDRLIRDIEKDFPELRQDIENATGDSSGTALRTAQQRIETKAQARRSGYDAALRAALTYAVRIAAIRGYGPEFEPFTPDKVSANPDILSFRIGDRPTFRSSKLDELIAVEKDWAIYESMDRAGCPLPAAMKLRGMPPEAIALVVKAREEALAAGLPVGRAKQAAPNSEPAATAIQAPGGAAP